MLFQVLKGNFSFTQILIYILSSLIVVFLTLPVHEFAHGYVATKLGDPTPKWQGRLSLNPLAHIDYIGAAAILIFGFGWAKPVQIDMRYFKNPKRDMAITAFAGPVANVIMALISLLIGNIFYMFSYDPASPYDVSSLIYVWYFFFYIANINVYLAVFNLIPIPPFDGSRLLSAFLPDRLYYKLMRYERYLVIAVFAFFWIGILDVPISFLSNAVMKGLMYVADIPFRFIMKV